MSNAFSNRVGVTIEEGITNAVNLNSNISTRNIGLLTERERGVDGVAMLVNNTKEDKKIFGGHNPNMYSSYVIENLFNNAGGYPVNIFQVRLVGDGSLASKTIVKNASANTQTLVSVTTQNASSSPSQGQINEISVTTVEVGDVFTLNLDFAPPGISNKDYIFTATTTNPIDVINGLKALLIADPEDIQGDMSLTIVDGKLVMTSFGEEVFTVVTSTVNDATSENIFEVVAGRQGKEDKGLWGNDLKVRVYPIGHTNGSSEGYKLEIFYKGYLVEAFISKGTNWLSLIDSVNQRSGYIMINPLDLTKELTLNVFDSSLAGGTYISPTSADFEPSYNAITDEPEGMAIFEGIDVQLLACPEMFSVAFAKSCDAFARKVNKFFIFSLPYLATESVMETYYNALFTPDQSFSGSVLNWVEVPADQDGNKIWIPAIGYALGAGYIRKAGLFNGEVWTPPAGIETNARSIFRITHENLSEDKLSRYVKKWRTNVIKHIKNVGFCLWSSRTYSSNSLFESIHVRLETNWLVESLPLRNNKFIQRLFTPTLQKDMKVHNLIWFKNLYERGGIERTIPFEDAVIIEVEVTKENRKEAEMDIYWIPPECLEHIHIRVNRNDGILILNF